MTTWTFPDGWTLETSTEQIEVTRHGLLPPYVADDTRRWVPGKTRAWLTGPAGEHIPIAVPFTLADVQQAIGASDA